MRQLRQGGQPAARAWRPAPLRRRTRWRNVRADGDLLGHLAASRAKGVTLRRTRRPYPDRTRDRVVTRDELLAAVTDWREAVDFATLDDGWLTAGEVLTTACALLLGEPAYRCRATGRGRTCRR